MPFKSPQRRLPIRPLPLPTDKTVGPAALTHAFENHRKLLWGASYRTTGLPADADDVAQEMFLPARLGEGNVPKTGPHAPGWVKLTGISWRTTQG